MDEPFAALDAQLRAVMQEELLDLWQTDRRTVLFVTHSLEEAILLGDRVAGHVGSTRAVARVRRGAVPAAPGRGDPELARVRRAARRLWDMLRAEVEQYLRDLGDEMVPSR